ncbi:recombinase RecT [Barnesiella intestinihominis]|uniref:recombinase RecT n=1 Tax=Barnesiella intestinihominis TaxID=487174 RepID=UPI002665247C|nr:recombinase RecT [Barnesiella intestinihominis]
MATTTLPQLKSLLNGDSVKTRFNEILGKKAPGFISSVISAVNGNTMLQTADPQSILNSAVIAATLDLPINSNLGLSAIVPYYDSKLRTTVAQFQLMYKGLIELCLRSGQFSSLIDEVVYEGQLVKKNKFTGEYIFDEDSKTSDKVIGYMAYFRLVNGFEKTHYMTVGEVEAHAKKYSQSYKKGFGVWKDDFDTMARKTVLKLLLAKYAPKSIEMQLAITFDQTTIKGDLTQQDTSVDEVEIEYVDNDTATDRLREMAIEAVEQPESENVNGQGLFE